MGRRQKTVFPATAKRVTEALRATGGNHREAAAALGISRRRVEHLVKVMRDNNQEVPASEHSLKMLGHYRPNQAQIHGASTLLNAQGEVVQQWIKEKAGAPSPEEFAKQVREAFADCQPLKVIPAPRDTKDLLCVYPMGDPHLGMYAWAEETGADFDLDIAERNLVAATRALVANCPPSEQALIVNVGDFFHADNKENRTLRSGAALDVDTRWAKVLRVGLRAMKACIDAALERHKKVHVINEIGNHDEHSAQMLTIALAMHYDKNPRVTFDESPAKFHYYRFGKVFIGVTHGDTAAKLDGLGAIMATDRPADWGATIHRYWYTGHIHHRRVLELRGCVVESFRTLAARDAWHAGEGYRAGRDMSAIVLDKEHGEVMRHRVDITMLEKIYGGK